MGVVTIVYDNDRISVDKGETSGSGLGDCAASSSKDCDGSLSLGDEVGVYESFGFARFDTNSDIDAKENIEGNLSLHDLRASSKVIIAYISIARADNIALVSANRSKRNKVKLTTTVVFIFIDTKVVGT